MYIYSQETQRWIITILAIVVIFVMPTCEFSFERDTSVYVCGEQLSGNVAVTLVKERLLEGMYFGTHIIY